MIGLHVLFWRKYYEVHFAWISNFLVRTYISFFNYKLLKVQLIRFVIAWLWFERSASYKSCGFFSGKLDKTFFISFEWGYLNRHALLDGNGNSNHCFKVKIFMLQSFYVLVQLSSFWIIYHKSKILCIKILA